MSVVDRGEPVASCSEWHGDGTAGEDHRAAHLAAVAPTRAMGETRPGGHQPRWQAAKRRGRATVQTPRHSADRMVTVNEDRARFRQDPQQEQEWLRQLNLIYSGLIGIGVVMIQPFLTAASLDLTARSA